MKMIAASVGLAEISDLTQPEVRRQRVVASIAGAGRVLVDQGDKRFDQAGDLEVVGLRMSDQQLGGFVGAATVEGADDFDGALADPARSSRDPKTVRRVAVRLVVRVVGVNHGVDQGIPLNRMGFGPVRCVAHVDTGAVGTRLAADSVGVFGLVNNLRD